MKKAQPYTVTDNFGRKYSIYTWKDLRKIVGAMHGISAPVSNVKITSPTTAEFYGLKFTKD